MSFLLPCAITVSIFFALLLARPAALVLGAYFYLALLLVASLVFVFTPSLVWMFVAFECLLLTSLGLLKLTSKSERIGEAVSEMFMWTLFGSFFLLLGFFSLYAEYGTNMDALASSVALGASATPGLIGVFFLVGFGVKVPV